jgi:hypothetical protein
MLENLTFLNILGFIFLLIGVIICALLVRYILITGRCSRWPVVVGEVISAERKARYKKLAQFTEASHVYAGPYQPDITYTYEIDGKEFTNNTLRPVGKNLWRGAGIAQRVLSVYPKGSKVYVYYSPSDPNNSVLDPWIRFSALAINIPAAMIFLGLGLSFIGIEMFIDWGIALISYALYIASALIMAQNIRYLVNVIKCQRWPNVEGEVKKVDVYRSLQQDSGYKVTVTYDYEVEGQIYTSHQRKLGYVHGTSSFIPRLFAMLKMAKYEEGKKVKVYYDPKKPNHAILERGILPFTIFMMFLVAISLFIMGWLGIPAMIYEIISGSI